MPGKCAVIGAGRRCDHARLHQQSGDGQHQAIDGQYRGLEPCQRPHQAPSSDGCLPGDHPDRRQRQDCTDDLQHRGRPYRQHDARITGAALLLERASDGVEQPGTTQRPVHADGSIGRADTARGLREPQSLCGGLPVSDCRSHGRAWRRGGVSARSHGFLARALALRPAGRSVLSPRPPQERSSWLSRSPVSGEVVLAAQPVVIHPGRMRALRCNAVPRPARSGHFASSR